MAQQTDKHGYLVRPTTRRVVLRVPDWQRVLVAVKQDEYAALKAAARRSVALARMLKRIDRTLKRGP
jgi:hypothetical protein